MPSLYRILLYYLLVISVVAAVVSPRRETSPLMV